MSSVPPHRRAIASATVAMARTMGMVLGVAVSGAVFNGTFQGLSNGIPLKLYQPSMESIFMTAFHTAMFGSVAVALVGVVISYLRGPENLRQSKGKE